MESRSLKLPGLIAGMVTLVLIGGCQTPQSAPTPAKAPVAVAPLPTGRNATADEAVASDPCSSRLHDIEGALLLYYAVNKHLPLVLQDAKPYADTGTQLEFSCPVSKQTYGYSQAGLLNVGTDKRIIVWDTAPVHHGMRWCIVMGKLTPGAPLTADVVPVPEKEFQSFIPPIQ